MKRIIFCFSSFLLIVLIFLVSEPELVQSVSLMELHRYMVSYRPDEKDNVKRDLQGQGAVIHYEFDDLNTFAVSLPDIARNTISSNPSIILFEEDPPRYPVSVAQPSPGGTREIQQSANPYEAQVIPYGIDMVQARDVWDANRDGIIDAGAFTGAGKKVCIIDSGLYTAHEDFSGVNVTGGDPTGWNSDGLGHGTHVAGTITAANNSVGVVGVTPGTVDLYIVRVFGDDGAWVYASTLIDAANRCQTAGADIISMSLSGPRASTQERNGFNTLYNNGILSIAAASNDGVSAYAYPASYDSVISVGAIDSTMTWANFSNFNDQVELAAPGVDVLSTVPFIEANTVTVDGITYYGIFIANTSRGSAIGTLVDGGLCGTTDPVNWSGKVVLCARGTYSFAQKVLNVQNSGGRAALIYNNVPGNFSGTIEPDTSTIIGLSLSQEDGQYLVANKLGLNASVVSNEPAVGSGYEAWAGTSMATPHVSGVAALAWSCLPSATNAQVRQALTATALDLGAAGRDNYYGYGLVQAWNACQELNPTAVDLLSFTAEGAYNEIILSWKTASEIDNLGFNLYRAQSPSGVRSKLNVDLIPTQTPPGSLTGATYVFVDTGSDLGPEGLIPYQTYYYWLEDVDLFGRSKLHGPVEATLLRADLPESFLIYLPMLIR